jgi:hypothetical protein
MRASSATNEFRVFERRHFRPTLEPTDQRRNPCPTVGSMGTYFSGDLKQFI